LFSALACRPGFAFLSALACRSLLTCRAGFALFSASACRANFAAITFFALLTALSLWTSFAAFPLRPGLALRAGSARRAVGAALQLAEPRHHLDHHLGHHLGRDVGAQFDDLRTKGGDGLGRMRLESAQPRCGLGRLRLDQSALALPLPTLGVENLGERFTPSLKQTVGGVRSGRRLRKGFGPLVQCHRDCLLVAAAAAAAVWVRTRRPRVRVVARLARVGRESFQPD